MSRKAISKLITKRDFFRDDAEQVCRDNLVALGCSPGSVVLVRELTVGIVEDRGEKINLFPNNLKLWVFEGEEDHARH